LQSSKINNVVSNRDSHPGPGAFIASAKNAEGQILEREIRTRNVCRFNPT
jgi:hypothetical protein